MQEWLRGEGQHHVRYPTDGDTREAGRHHTDDGEREALTLNLHGELAAHDIIGAAEVLAPEAMADDGDGTVRRGGAVVSWGEHPAAECRHAEHVEEAPADVGAVDGHGPAALRKVKGPVRPGEGAVEQSVCACADLLPYRVGPRTVREQRQASRIPHWQRPHDEAVEDREQRRVRADAERERGDGHERETSALAQPANGVADILSCVVECTHRPHLA